MVVVFVVSVGFVGGFMISDCFEQFGSFGAVQKRCWLISLFFASCLHDEGPTDTCTLPKKVI